MAQGNWRASTPLRGTQVLFRLIGANMNVTTDQALVKQFAFNNYVIDRILVTNASTSLTTAAGGIYSAAAKGGTAIVAAGQAHSGANNAAAANALTLASTARRNETPILSLTTGQGSAATADIYVIGTPLD